MPYELPPLPYAHNALEPYIDEQTMQIHHGKHHQAYVDNLNAALEKHPELQGKPIEQLIADIDAIPEDIRAAVRNNGGGHANHSFFWTIMGAKPAASRRAVLPRRSTPSSASFDAFKEAFAKAGTTRFGSGWAWLIKSGDGVEVMSTPNQDSPLMEGKTPLLGIDVWEHAYYLKYQNKRPDYIAAWWNVVNWDAVNKLF